MQPSFKKIYTSLLILGVIAASPAYAENVEPGKDGSVAADTSFRPKPNGFKFENWGGGKNPQGDLTADGARCLFGDQVCARFENGSCIPTPAASIWIREMNKSMSMGHCEGMAALSAAFHIGLENPKDYGTSTAFDVPLSNAKVLHAISTYFVTQGIEPVASKTRETRAMSLKDIVKTLTEAMKDPNDSYTLGIYGADGGHAITPFAVEDLGDGLYRIYVYDNNYPGVSNYVEVNLKTDTWSYAGAALNPGSEAAPWTGNSGSMDLTHLAWRLEPLVCPFCEDQKPVKQLQGCLAMVGAQPASKDPAAKPTPTPKKPPAKPKPSPQQSPEKPKPSPKMPPGSGTVDDMVVYTDAHCNDIKVTDKKTGHQIYIEKNKTVSQIPGAFLMMRRGTKGCYAGLPAGGDYEFSVGGMSGQSTEKVDVTFIRPGMVYSVSDIDISAKDADVFQLSGENFTYKPGENSQAMITVATDDKDGTDELYVINDLALNGDHSFTIGENDNGDILLDSDDPEQKPFDLETTVSDENEDISSTQEDFDIPDNGEVVLSVAEDGTMEIDLDSDSDGVPDEVDTDDDGDGSVDSQDADDDNDGILDAQDESNADNVQAEEENAGDEEPIVEDDQAGKDEEAEQAGEEEPDAASVDEENEQLDENQPEQEEEAGQEEQAAEEESAEEEPTAEEAAPEEEE